MTEFNLIVLYVRNSDASAAFYKMLLERPVVQSSPKFSVLPIGGEAQLGLWQRDAVQPPAGDECGGSEIVFTVADREAVQEVHDTWRRRGAKIAQAPVTLEFGHTFVALDPDGNRLRVLAPT